MKTELDIVIGWLIHLLKCSHLHCPYYRKNKCTPPKTNTDICRENIKFFAKKEVENEQINS